MLNEKVFNIQQDASKTRCMTNNFGSHWYQWQKLKKGMNSALRDVWSSQAVKGSNGQTPQVTEGKHWRSFGKQILQS